MVVWKVRALFAKCFNFDVKLLLELVVGRAEAGVCGFADEVDVVVHLNLKIDLMSVDRNDGGIGMDPESQRRRPAMLHGHLYSK